MSKIIFFGQDDANEKYFSVLEKYLKDLSPEVIFANVNDIEMYKSTVKSEENLIVVDINPWVDGKSAIIIDILERFPFGAILSFDMSRGLSDFSETLPELTNVQGVIDTSQDVRLALPLLRSVLTQKRNAKEVSYLDTLEKGLDGLIESSLKEFQRLKKIHEQVVPLRNENIKGLQVYSKFAAGESSGGEFFDMIKKDQEVCLILTNTRSYVASSIILSHFEQFRERESLTKDVMEDFLEELVTELRELELVDRENPELLQILLMRIDLKSMKSDGFHFGGAEIFSTSRDNVKRNNYPVNENFFEKAYFNMSLKRGEKLLIVSPGLNKNNTELGTNLDFSDLLETCKEKNVRELFNEVFYQSKKKVDGDFLKHDASIIYIEVDPNVIIQV